MRSRPRLICSVFLLLAAPAAPAAEAFDPAARAAAIAPFLDTQTIAVWHADLTRLDPGPLVDKLRQLVPEAEVDRDTLRQVHEQVLKTGARDVYVVASLADLPQRAPFAILPGAPGLDVDALTALVQSLLPPRGTWRLAPLKGALFVGEPRTLQRLEAAAPDARPELVEAFRAAGDTLVQVLLLPTDDDRRVVEELLPQLPEQIGGGPSTVLTRGVQWLAIGLDGPPEISVRLSIQSADPQAAAALRAKWVAVAQLLAEGELPQKHLRELGKAMAALTLAVEDNRLGLHVSEPDGSLQPLLDAVALPLEGARDRARRVQSMNNLKQLGLAMHNYHDVRKRLPAVGSQDAAGRPLLSWRVHLLPYLEQRQLYERFRLDEPWDSEHNRLLVAEMPPVFRSPASKHKPQTGLATYRVVVGERTGFTGPEGIEFKQITDGTSNTIMAVEVDDDHAVIWTKPEGLSFDQENPATGLGGQFEGGFHCVFFDGSARFLELPHDAEQLRRLLIRDDGKLTW